jgi:hypothetical protein
MSSVKKFEGLEIWQLSRKLCNDIYIICTSTLLKNDFKLRNQINGSSGSVMDNIAEETFLELKEQTLVLSRKTGSFINYLNKTDFKGIKYK